MNGYGDDVNGIVYIWSDCNSSGNPRYYVGETKNIKNRYKRIMQRFIIAKFPEPMRLRRYYRERELIEFCVGFGLNLLNEQYNEFKPNQETGT